MTNSTAALNTSDTDYGWDSTSHRRREQGEVFAKKFLARIGALEIFDPAPDLGGGVETRDLVVRYAIQAHLNVEWYTKRREHDQKAQNRLWVGLVIGGVVMFGLAAGGTVYLGNAALAGVTLASIVPLLKILAVAGDRRKQIGNFWKASAALKEGIYDFEDAWRGRPVITLANTGTTTVRHVDPEFVQRLQTVLAQARAIETEERSAFFATMQSPSDLLSVAIAGVDAASQKRREMDKVEEARTVAADRLALQAKLDAAETQLIQLEVESKAAPGVDPVTQMSVAKARFERDRLRRNLGLPFKP